MDNLNINDIRSNIEASFAAEKQEQAKPKFKIVNKDEESPGDLLKEVLGSILKNLLANIEPRTSFFSDIDNEYFTNHVLKVNMPDDGSLNTAQQLKVMGLMNFYTGTLTIMTQIVDTDKIVEMHESLKKKFDVMMDYILFGQTKDESSELIFDFIHIEFQKGILAMDLSEDKDLPFLSLVVRSMIKGFEFGYKFTLDLSNTKQEEK